MGYHYGRRAPALDWCDGDRLVDVHLRASAVALAILTLGVLTMDAAPAGRPKCDGVHDTSDALQAVFDTLRSGDTLTLPAGICRTSRALRLEGKQHITVQGAATEGRREATTLRLADPRNGALMILGGEDIAIRRLRIEGAASTRGSQPIEHGLNATNTRNLLIDHVEVVGVAGAGVHLCRVHGAVVQETKVLDTRADGVHVTCGSVNVTLSNNMVRRSGDDCFASVGYGAVRNHNITIRANRCEDGAASGVTIGGTTGAVVRENHLVRTGAAGIRVESEQYWSTEHTDNVLIEGNVLVGVRRRADIGHPALLVYSNFGAISDVRLRNNIVQDPETQTGVQLYATSPGILANIEVAGTRITSRERRVTQCVLRGDGASTPAQVVRHDNTLEGKPCF